MPDSFPEATAEEITESVDEAVSAGARMARLSSAERAEFLRRLAHQLARQGPRLVARADVESGLGRDLLSRELADCGSRLVHLAAAVADGEDVAAVLQASDAGGHPTRTMRVPRGPVVVFGSPASPFAFGVPGADTASALAAGCPVIAKASPAHPATAEACAAVVDGALAASGWPAGAHALLHGHRAAVGEELVAAHGVAAVGFTGDRQSGRALFDLATARTDPIPFFGGLASLNPVVVTSGAITTERDRVAAQIADAVTYAGGQSPVRPGLVIVPADAVATRLRGAGRQPMLTADLHSAFAAAAAERGAAAGVTTLVGQVIDAGQGYAQEPVLLSVGFDDFRASPVLGRDCSGPLAIAVRAEADQVAELFVDLPGSLAGGLYADLRHDDRGGVARVLAAMAGRVGRVVVNESLALPAPGARGAHVGPWPSATDAGWTSLGPEAIRRWQRGMTYQSLPDELLPPPLQDANPWGIVRDVDGTLTRDPLSPGRGSPA
jgi:NADP-dependent aldehyde dehydrogenase